ncbi:MAG: hypothetical protein NTW59_04645, partial [Candidatus Diapherotrites archaeon]|nr:hypothetical protein [Candidatus Diapherotrites archaeon]
HQDPSFTYPGTGFASENSQHIRNVPLPAGLADKQFIALFKKNFEECFDSFRPELVAVSAGFDAFESDAGAVGSRLAVKEHETFNSIGKIINKKTEEKSIPCFGVLEGGYNIRDLPLNVFNFLNAFK